MAITNQYGFDNFGARTMGDAGLPANDVNGPYNGAGLDGTPFANELKITLGSPGEVNFRSNAVGVTGRDAHKVGSGDERRNMLILQRAGNVGSTTYASVTVGAPRNIFTGAPFQRCTGFNIIELPPTALTANYNLIQHRRGSSLSGLIVRSPTTITCAGRTLPFERNRAYYIEIIEAMVGLNLTIEVWVDGELWVPAFTYTTLPANSTYLSSIEAFTAEGGVGPASSPCWLGISDIYVTDGAGQAPFNGRLGPQVVLPIKVTGATATDWQITGTATTPLEVLTTPGDASTLVSKLGHVEMSVNAEVQLKPGSAVNAMELYTRGRRDVGISRRISATARRADGTVVANPTPSAMATGFAVMRVAQLSPASPADRQVLDFTDSGKVTVLVSSD